MVRHPDSGALYEQYGDILALAGKTSEAAGAYEKAMSLDSNLTGITLKIQALEEEKKKTPLGLLPVLVALLLSGISWRILGKRE